MNRSREILLAFFLAGLANLSARPYFNDQKVPESLDDLRKIQHAVQESLEEARAATVCVELKGGTGTGVIISPKGLVLTAAHVSTGVDVNLEVVLEDGRKLKARSLGLNSENDAAMIQIIEEGEFPYVPYNTKSDFRLGDWVFALGHSGGFDKLRGVVARVGRLVKLTPDTLQSDCLLIGGDSGGPLFDMSGTLIGIHSRVGKVKDDSRHVPLEAFERSWEAMKKGAFLGRGPFAKPRVPGSGFLGVVVEFDAANDQLTIREVVEGSPAADAGLESGMSIVEIDGISVGESNLLEETLAEKSLGEELKLKWLRGEEEGEVIVELGEKP